MTQIADHPTGAQPVCVYFHGMPGSSLELELAPGLPTDGTTFVPDRFGFARDIDAGSSFELIAADLASRFIGRRLALIGFSLGGYVALEVAARTILPCSAPSL